MCVAVPCSQSGGTVGGDSALPTTASVDGGGREEMPPPNDRRMVGLKEQTMRQQDQRFRELEERTARANARD